MEWNVHFYFSVKQFLPSTFDSNFHLGVFCCTIQDIELSREINDSFRQSAQARSFPAHRKFALSRLETPVSLVFHVFPHSYLNI